MMIKRNNCQTKLCSQKEVKHYQLNNGELCMNFVSLNDKSPISFSFFYLVFRSLKMVCNAKSSIKSNSGNNCHQY